MLAFDLFRHGLVIEPAVAMADDLVPVLDKGARQFRVALGCFGDRQQACLDPEPAEQPQQAPAADARAVLEDGLDERARSPGNIGAPMSLSTPSEPSSPSEIERSPPPSKLRLMLTAIRALPGHRGSGGVAP